MHDIRFIREHPEAFDKGMARRGLSPLAAELLSLDERRRQITTELQGLQTRRNAASKEIGAVKSKGGDAQALMDEVASIKAKIGELEQADRGAEAALAARLAELPNLPDEDVPDGPDESANVELRRVGEPRRLNAARDHVDLGEGLGLMDFAAASKLSGSRFVVLRGALARLERAIGQFMIDLHTTEHGYTEIAPPVLVRDEALFGTGQLPKFAEDQFRTNTGHWLIPTAEVPLTNLVAGDILEQEALPLRLTALTPCFRSEAGAAGRDTRGMIRQHQFSKVELVSITTPEQSAAEHERMTECAETVLKRLGLAFRTMALCTGDMGFSARKTYDIEVWLPGQGRYREISSCSNCGDFQARRMQGRFRPAGEKGTRFLHTLNGSGVAVGRALIAVLETYQRQDGSIEVPEALRPYMGGLEILEAKG
ncbi:serine--tRNA ligase [Inquilinus limosus]|uniref:serine--tRNA ligase n=1 Tax=Inquilinus limosus TaxID=171674 RepID=UPI000409DE65|nr:serine--tRNA ligase [Inquilinus limosus]